FASSMAEPAPSVQTLLRTLPKARLVDLGRQFGVAIARPNGVPKGESVARLVGSQQLVFKELVEWMRGDELRLACRGGGSAGPLAERAVGGAAARARRGVGAARLHLRPCP